MRRAIVTGAAVGLVLGMFAAAYTRGRAAYTDADKLATNIADELERIADAVELATLAARIDAALDEGAAR